MEQVFFINPVAGKRDASAELVPRIQAAARQLQPAPASNWLSHSMPVRPAKQPAQYAASGTPAALYACGGDGTLNELVQGAAGSANVAVGCVPCGSGNDYVRNFGAAGQAPFLDFAAQLQAQPTGWTCCKHPLVSESISVPPGWTLRWHMASQNSGGCGMRGNSSLYALDSTGYAQPLRPQAARCDRRQRVYRYLYDGGHL